MRKLILSLVALSMLGLAIPAANADPVVVVGHPHHHHHDKTVIIKHGHDHD